MSELEEYEKNYNDWVETYKPKEFIEYSHEDYEKLQSHDEKYIWTNHGTCEEEQFTNGCHEYKSNCGCWDNFGWWICENPWEGNSASLFISTEYRGECPECNADASEENINPDCEECEGSGYVQIYFD